MLLLIDHLFSCLFFQSFLLNNNLNLNPVKSTIKCVFSFLLSTLFGMKWWISVLHLFRISKTLVMQTLWIYKPKKKNVRPCINLSVGCFTLKQIGFMLIFPQFARCQGWWLHATRLSCTLLEVNATKCVLQRCLKLKKSEGLVHVCSANR